MANTPKAKKRIRRNTNRAEINGARVSRIRSSEICEGSRIAACWPSRRTPSANRPNNGACPSDGALAVVAAPGVRKRARR